MKPNKASLVMLNEEGTGKSGKNATALPQQWFN